MRSLCSHFFMNHGSLFIGLYYHKYGYNNNYVWLNFSLPALQMPSAALGFISIAHPSCKTLFKCSLYYTNYVWSSKVPTSAVEARAFVFRFLFQLTLKFSQTASRDFFSHSSEGAMIYLASRRAPTNLRA